MKRPSYNPITDGSDNFRHSNTRLFGMAGMNAMKHEVLNTVILKTNNQIGRSRSSPGAIIDLMSLAQNSVLLSNDEQKSGLPRRNRQRDQEYNEAKYL